MTILTNLRPEKPEKASPMKVRLEGTDAPDQSAARDTRYPNVNALRVNKSAKGVTKGVETGCCVIESRKEFSSEKDATDKTRSTNNSDSQGSS